MADITIYLVKRCMLLPSIESAMREQLQAHFDAVLQRNDEWREDYTVTVRIGSSCPTLPNERDVVVYLVQNAGASVLSQFGVVAHGHGGLTVMNITPGRQTASEVYVGTSNATLLAKVAFHEALHNKTGWSNNRLHHYRGGSITAAVLRVDTGINDRDLDLMGQHLGRRHRQWSGGCR